MQRRLGAPTKWPVVVACTGAGPALSGTPVVDFSQEPRERNIDHDFQTRSSGGPRTFIVMCLYPRLEVVAARRA